MTIQPSTAAASEGFVRLDYAMKNYTKYEGETVTMLCDISGSPLPRYKWYQNATSIDDTIARFPRFHTRLTSFGSRMKITSLTVGDTASYSCTGSNKYGKVTAVGSLVVLPGFNPNKSPPQTDDEDVDDPTSSRDRDESPDYSDVIEPIMPEIMKPREPPATQTPNYCMEFRGTSCGHLVTGQKIYVNKNTDPGNKENRVTRATMELLLQLPSSCHNLAVLWLCYSSYTLCDSDSRPRPVCRSDCSSLQQALKQAGCMDQYTSVINKFYDVGYSDLACNSMPADGSREAANCVHISLNDDHSCYNDTGQNYRGPQNKGSSGRTCMRWESPLVQNKGASVSTYLYKELDGHNFCRNPGNAEKAPWCYIQSTTGALTREYCEVTKCTGLDSQPIISDILFILIPSVAVPVLLILLLVFVCICRRNRQSASKGSPTNSRPIYTPQHVEMNAMLPKPNLRARDFPISQVRFLEELGEGSFGKVYKGELMGFYADGSVTPITIKSLRETSVPQTQTDFRREVDLLSDLKHPNIVCLLGVSMRDKPWCMLFEYVGRGDLHEYLITHSPHSDVFAVDDPDRSNGSFIEPAEMLHLVSQVAAGMEYLSAHHVVHRDLATRNILLAEGLMVKIADFGLSRNSYSTDYLCLPNKTPLPIRWMAPESLLYGRYSSESDVWSFGIVMWEVYSFGLQPYYGYTNHEVMEMVQSRQVLPCPEECPSNVYALMVECWHEMPVRRPSFKELNARLRLWKADIVPSYTSLIPQANLSNHSSSTNQSGQSHHSSNTGPSNNTATTNISSQNSGPHLTSSPLQNFPAPQIATNRTLGFTNKAMYCRPSPPGSITSHRTPSLPSSASPASSLTNYRMPNSGMANGRTVQSPIGTMQNGVIHSPTQGYPLVKTVNGHVLAAGQAVDSRTSDL